MSPDFDPIEAERIRATDVARYAATDTPAVIRRRQAHAADAAYTLHPDRCECRRCTDGSYQR